MLRLGTVSKNLLAEDGARLKKSSEVKVLRSESALLKKVLDEPTLENRPLKSSMNGDLLHLAMN